MAKVGKVYGCLLPFHLFKGQKNKNKLFFRRLVRRLARKVPLLTPSYYLRPGFWFLVSKTYWNNREPGENPGQSPLL